MITESWFQILILSLIIGTSIFLLKRIFFSKRKENEEISMEGVPEFENIDFVKFNIEEDIDSLNFLVNLITGEFVDREIMNANDDKTGHKKIYIPDTNKKHQENIDKITNTVMNLLSDEHIMYLKKYISLSNLKYITRIYVKRTYKELIDATIQYRLQKVREEDRSLQESNKQFKVNSDYPNHIQEILNYYEITPSQAKSIVKNVDINEDKLKQHDPGSREREYYENMMKLKNYFYNQKIS